MDSFAEFGYCGGEVTDSYICFFQVCQILLYFFFIETALVDNIISALSNVLSLEESTPDFLPKEVILKGRTIYGFISLVLKSECVMPTPNIGKSA